jgi:hypothetical protein
MNYVYESCYIVKYITNDNNNKFKNNRLLKIVFLLLVNFTELKKHLKKNC